MRLRTLTLWKKLKPLWLGIASWACISIVMMVLWGYSIMDFRGGLPDVKIANSQTISLEKKQTIRTIDIHAEGVTVEIGSSYDVKEVKLQLYGDGYINQKASWELNDAGDLTIRLDPYPVIANAYGHRDVDNLVLRILLPTKSYDAITVHGKRINAVLYQCKGKQLTANVDYGSIALQKTDFQRAELLSNTSDIAIERSRIHNLRIENLSGDTYLLDNQLHYWNYHSLSGNLEVLTNKLDGIWELSGGKGDIHVGTRKWHQNLLLQLHSEEGTVTASSSKKPWKETIPAALTERELILLEGRGENMLCVTTESGDIRLDTVKFER